MQSTRTRNNRNVRSKKGRQKKQAAFRFPTVIGVGGRGDQDLPLGPWAAAAQDDEQPSCPGRARHCFTTLVPCLLSPSLPDHGLEGSDCWIFFILIFFKKKLINEDLPISLLSHAVGVTYEEVTSCAVGVTHKEVTPVHMM
jgi:hypothetical protein